LLIKKDGYFRTFNELNEKNKSMEFIGFSLDFAKEQVLK